MVGTHENLLQGALVGVVGRVGSGKSSLLNALLAEMRCTEGSVCVDPVLLEEGFGLASQEAWIQHATLRENILFGQQFDRERYEAVIKGCALTDDLQVR